MGAQGTQIAPCSIPFLSVFQTITRGFVMVLKYLKSSLVLITDKVFIMPYVITAAQSRLSLPSLEMRNNGAASPLLHYWSKCNAVFKLPQVQATFSVLKFLSLVLFYKIFNCVDFSLIFFFKYIFFSLSSLDINSHYLSNWKTILCFMKSFIWGWCLTIQVAEPHLLNPWSTDPCLLSTAIPRQTRACCWRTHVHLWG